MIHIAVVGGVMGECEGRSDGWGVRETGHMPLLVCGLTLERASFHAVCLHDVLKVLDENAQPLRLLITAFILPVILQQETMVA